MHAIVPKSFRKLVLTKLSPIFKDAIDIVHQNITRPCPKEVLVRNNYVGVNASDLNVRYPCDKQKFPLDIGFEGIGEVVDFGDEVEDLKYGDPVMHLKLGAFSEYMYIPADEVIPVPSLKPDLLPLLVSGTTASLSLDKCAQIVPGEKVLITAADGDAGHLAVQWAKNVGCHVIGTCSSEEAVPFLESIGCDHVIHSKKQSLEKILTKEYSSGVDIVWDSVGGDVLLRHLSARGRLVMVGCLPRRADPDLLLKLVRQSWRVCGFSWCDYASDVPHYMNLLVRLHHERRLKPVIDRTETFRGLESVVEALQFLQSGKNKGKVVVQL